MGTTPPPDTPHQAPDLDHFNGRLFITLDEAAVLYGVSPRTARRWASDYLASGGEYGIPVVQVTRRRRLVPVAQLFKHKVPGSRG